MCYIYGRRMLHIGDRAFRNIDSVVSKINTMVTDSLSYQAIFRVCVLTLYIYMKDWGMRKPALPSVFRLFIVMTSGLFILFPFYIFMFHLFICFVYSVLNFGI